MSDVLKQFIKGGLLSERMYRNEEDEDEQGDDTVSFKDAKIDPELDQVIGQRVSIRTGEDESGLSDEQDGEAEGDEEAEDDEAEDGDQDSEEETEEADDPEAAPDEAQDAGAGPSFGMKLLVESLCQMLATTHHFADRLAANKDQFIALFGDEKLPLLNEVIHKVGTAYEMLDECLKALKDGEQAEEAEEPGEADADAPADDQQGDEAQEDGDGEESDAESEDDGDVEGDEASDDDEDGDEEEEDEPEN